MDGKSPGECDQIDSWTPCPLACEIRIRVWRVSVVEPELPCATSVLCLSGLTRGSRMAEAFSLLSVSPLASRTGVPDQVLFNQ